MSDPVEVMLNSPRSMIAMKKLGLKSEDIQYINKEELKAKLGNMKITKHELEHKWEEYEASRKDKISKILEVRYIFVDAVYKLLTLAKKENGNWKQEPLSKYKLLELRQLFLYAFFKTILKRCIFAFSH